MTSESCYVWIYLPKKTTPVVAGKLELKNGFYLFNYGQSYLNNPEAIPLYSQELPLKKGIQEPLSGLTIPGCLRDAAPDAWGRRVIMNRFADQNLSDSYLNEIKYLLLSGSDRIGALDFQMSNHDYSPREQKQASLESLQKAAGLIESGALLPATLQMAIQHGTSIGGARPKALITTHNEKYIAKFSSSSDILNVIKIEFLAMHMAKLLGLNVADVKLTKSAKKDVLLIKRFDREHVDSSFSRKIVISALTLLGLDEMMARYASYEALALIIRKSFPNPKVQLKELFSRLTYNILCGNTDDHARNHAVFWDGHQYSLTPAYDICPQNRAGNEASQAMLVFKNSNLSLLDNCLRSASSYLLEEQEAKDIIDNQIALIHQHWNDACDFAQLSLIERNQLFKRQFLNPFIFQNS